MCYWSVSLSQTLSTGSLLVAEVVVGAFGRQRKTITIGSCAEGLSIPDYRSSRPDAPPTYIVGRVDQVSPAGRAVVDHTMTIWNYVYHMRSLTRTRKCTRARVTHRRIDIRIDRRTDTRIDTRIDRRIDTRKDRVERGKAHPLGANRTPT